MKRIHHHLTRISPTALIGAAVAIALLYFARSVFIPLSLAVLLSFLLAMPCAFLERHGFKRSLAVLLVVIVAFALIGGIVWIVSTQFYDLAKRLPGYQETIRHKVQALKAPGKGAIGKASRILQETAHDLQAPPAKESPPSHLLESETGGSQTERAPLPVEVHQPSPGGLDVVKGIAGSILKPAATCFMVLVVLVFMLAAREDLRNRVIRLAGTDRMDLTTDALDEAANRVSRYLLMQLVVNLCYGVLIGAGLYFIRVPSPLLWGLLATLLRFIPYAGWWVSAAIPLVLSFAIEPGWSKLLWTGGLFVAVELLTANAIEPLLYSSSTGVSPVALLLAAIFWTWIWGPVGLLLSTPLTVCLAVMGLHVPQLRFLHVLLGDEPVLTLEVRFYQRMLAMDREEAATIVETFLKGKHLTAAYEEVIIPALSYAKEDRARGRLAQEKEKFLLENVRELVEELEEEESCGKPGADRLEADQPEAPPAAIVLGPDQVAVVPAKDEIDEIAGLMLAQLLRRRGIATRLLPAAALTAESLEELVKTGVKVVCISSVPPAELRRARYLWKKASALRPGLKLVGAVWGASQSLDDLRQKLADFKPDSVVNSFPEAVAAIVSLSNLTEASPALPAHKTEDFELEPAGKR